MKIFLLIIGLSISVSCSKTSNSYYCENYDKFNSSTGLTYERISHPLDLIVRDQLPIWLSNVKITNNSDKTKLIKLVYYHKGESSHGEFELSKGESREFDGWHQYGVKIFDIDNAYEKEFISFGDYELDRCSAKKIVKRSCNFMGINCKWEADDEIRKKMSFRNSQIKKINKKLVTLKTKIKDLEKRRDEQIENLINFEYKTQCTVLGSPIEQVVTLRKNIGHNNYVESIGPLMRDFYKKHNEEFDGMFSMICKHSNNYVTSQRYTHNNKKINPVDFLALLTIKEAVDRF